MGEPDMSERQGQPNLESVEVLVRADDEDYQGGIYVLLKKGAEYGFLVVGCEIYSAYDALKGCKSYKDIDELIDKLEAGVRWFDNLAVAKEYILHEHDRETSHYSFGAAWSQFKADVALVG